MIICARPSTVAEPPISFFMVSMPAEFFRSSPPLSKHTPLPTSVSFGAPGTPHGVDQRKILFQKFVAENDGKLCAMLLRQIACGCGKFFRSHIIGWRVDEVARQEHALGDARDIR